MLDDYLEHISKDLSAEIAEFTTNTVLLNSRYIFVSKQENQDYGFCTHCKGEFKMEKVKHNSDYHCPKCGSKCIIKHAWRGHKYLRDGACFMFYEKSKIDSNVITAKGISVARDYSGDYKSVDTGYCLEAIYIFDIGKRQSKMFKNNWYSGGFFETSSVYHFNINSMAKLPFHCSMDSIKNAIKDTNFKYCPYKEYSGYDMLKFIDLYTRYPIIEQITKVGLKSLIGCYLRNYCMHRVINWRGKDIFKMLKINRKDLKDLRAAKVEVTPLFLKLYQMANKDNESIPAADIKKLEIIVGYSLDRFMSILKYTSIKNAYSYLKKQSEIKRKDNYFSIVSTWDDYISDCIKLGMDLTSKNVLCPKNIETAHQNTIKQIKMKENAQLDQAITKRLESLNNYIFEKNGLIIRPAQNSSELIEEGKALNHCVGSYVSRYAKGETNIFAIRKINEIDKPFYTLEFKSTSIVQVRGKHNCAPTEEVAEFIKAFEQEKLKTKKTKIKVPA